MSSRVCFTPVLAACFNVSFSSWISRQVRKFSKEGQEILLFFVVCIMASNDCPHQTRSGKSFADNDVPETSRKGKGGLRKKDHDVKTRSHTSVYGDLKIGKSVYDFMV